MNRKLLLLLFSWFVSLSGFSQNLLTNGNFEEGTDYGHGWNNFTMGGAVATFSTETSSPQEGTKALKVVMTTPGSDDYSIQTIHMDTWPSVINNNYTMRFYARALDAGTVLRAVQQTNIYTAKDFTLNTTWQLYEWNFTAMENNAQLKFHYLKQTGTIWIDNITIEPTAPVVIPSQDSLKININTHYQTLEGFGAAQAFYDLWVKSHPNKEELYQLAFGDLGLDWIRIQNVYRNETNFQPDAAEIVQKANVYTEDTVRVLLTSWSPPADLKSNNNTNGGTLKKDTSGNFVYGAFGDYWKNSLAAYANAGVQPSWISIQNEPDFLNDGWPTCKFNPTEQDTLPGYDKALDSVYDRIKDMPNVPKLLGPDVAGLNDFTKYSDPIKSRNYLYAYEYHLYDGNGNNPDSYNANLANIASGYNDRPNVMSEYEDSAAGWLKTAWIINNALTQANASAYFYWDLFWPNHGMISIENPWNSSTWTTTKGYTVTPFYYAFKHFSKHIKPGYIRVGGGDNNSFIRSSAFISPAGDKLVVVLINTASASITTSVTPTGKKVLSSSIFQSVENNYYQSKGALNASLQVLLPANSVTTVELTLGECAAAPAINAGTDIVKCQNETAVLSGSVSSGNDFVYWSTSGTGKFTPDSTALDATYTPSPADSANGNVTLTLTALRGGCGNVSDNLKITYQTFPTIDAGKDTILCSNVLTLQLNGKKGGSATGGTWTTSGSGLFVLPNMLNAVYVHTSGNIPTLPDTLTLTSTGGCKTVSDKVVVTYVTLPAIIPTLPDVPGCMNQNVTIPSIPLLTGSWKTSGSGTFTPDNTAPTSYVPSMTDFNSGSVTLTFIPTGLPCNTEIPLHVVFSVCEGVGSALEATDIKVYPVPANNMLYADLGNRRDISEAIIINAVGETVKTESVPSSALSIDINNLAPGLYKLLLKASDGNFYLKNFSKY